MERAASPLPIHSFNHISRETENVARMEDFYRNVLGFQRIRRPQIKFPGAWLALPGRPDISIHLIQRDPSAKCILPERALCSPSLKRNGPQAIRRSHHLAFRTENIDKVRDILDKRGINYFETTIAGTSIRQIFFFDPDRNGIEIGNFPEEQPPFIDDSEEENELSGEEESM